MSHPTIEETQASYLNVYGEKCSTDQATAILHDFVRYRSWADKIEKTEDHKKWCIDPETIEEFIEGRKMRDDREKEHREYEEKVSKMSPTERFLHTNGFDCPFGKWVQEFVDNSDKGKALYEEFCCVWNGDEHGLMRRLLEGISEYSKTNPPPEVEKIPSVDDFFSSEYSSAISGWFDGIFNDGERALRTMHVCIRAFFIHDWSTFQVFSPEKSEDARE